MAGGAPGAKKSSTLFSEVPYRIWCRKNAPFSVLVCKIASAVPKIQDFGRSLLHATLMRSKHVLFLPMAVSNIISECVSIMHAKASLYQNDLCSSNSFQIPPKCTIYCPWFQSFSLQFQKVSNAIRMHYLSSLFSIVYH